MAWASHVLQNPTWPSWYDGAHVVCELGVTWLLLKLAFTCSLTFLWNERDIIFHGDLAASLRIRSSFFENHNMLICSQFLVVFFSSLGWGITRLSIIMIQMWYPLLCFHGEKVFVWRTRVFAAVLTSITCIDKIIFHDYELIIFSRWLFQCAWSYLEIHIAVMSCSWVQLLP